jgi:hypothetical protein
VAEPSNTSKPSTTLPATADDLENLIARAKRGDEGTLPRLRDLLRDPALVDALGGDLAGQVERSLVYPGAGQDLAFREAILRKLELLREVLAGPNPTPVEKLLVERAVTCWLQVQFAELRVAQAKNPTIAQGDYQQRLIDRAHRRYLSALKTLALVRKLALPVLQVNIAKKQVNVAG